MSLLDNKFYYPSRKNYYDPAEGGYEPQSVHFDSTDGVRLHAWWFRSTNRRQGTVVHCHGNAGNVTGHFVHTAWLSRHGYDVLCFDYRGYGESTGRPTRAGTIADAHAALNYVLTQDDPGPLLLFGQSLGGAVAIVVAAERQDVAGIAVDGGFSHYQQEAEWVLRQSWLTRGVARPLSRWFISTGYDAIDYVQRISPTPVFLFHGKEDHIVPWEMSQDLYDGAAEPKALWLVEDMDHDQTLHQLADVARPKLVRFYNACVQASAIQDAHVAAIDTQSPGSK